MSHTSIRQTMSMKVLPASPLMIIGALVIFSPLQDGGTTHPAQMVIRLLILLLLGIALIKGIRTGQFSLPVLPIGYIALLFLGLAIAATVLSPYTHPSRQW